MGLSNCRELDSFPISGFPVLRHLERAETGLQAEVRVLQEEGCHRGVREAAMQEELPLAMWNDQQFVAAIFRPGWTLA